MRTRRRHEYIAGRCEFLRARCWLLRARHCDYEAGQLAAWSAVQAGRTATELAIWHEPPACRGTDFGRGQLDAALAAMELDRRLTDNG